MKKDKEEWGGLHTEVESWMNGRLRLGCKQVGTYERLRWDGYEHDERYVNKMVEVGKLHVGSELL